SILLSNASTIAPSIGSKPCSRKSAANAASSSAASTLRLCTSRFSSASGSVDAFSRSRAPRPSSRATTAQLARETTCERIFAIRPSVNCGNRSKSARAIASSSTESPRNSSRSYDAVRSAAQLEWVKTAATRSGGSAAISSERGLLVRRDVVDSLPDGGDLLRVLVGDLDPELVLELHDQLDEVERIGVQVFLERCVLADLALLDAELLGQDLLDSLVDLFTRRGHLSSLSRGLEARRSYTGARRALRLR